MRPIHYPIARLRYLSDAMSYEGTGDSKQACIHWASALALDLKQGLLTLGTVRAATTEEQLQIPGASLEPFIHAWVEVGPYLYAPTTIERTNGVLCAFLVSEYYKINGISDVRHVPRRIFDAIAKRWSLASALKHRLPRAGSGELAEDLLRAAGVQYVLSERRSILPKK
jgi:hypothetical protein